ncbi:hypothetical protein ACI2IY_02945 [Lysobacter enzymogenes]|uniref:hypothetical protein n=1 Tax=Lysobacter enzymogenes TaxID=69 RepID=UPI00384F10EA
MNKDSKSVAVEVLELSGMVEFLAERGGRELNSSGQLRISENQIIHTSVCCCAGSLDKFVCGNLCGTSGLGDVGGSVDIVYIDQNKWIDLARVHSQAVVSGGIYELYGRLTRAVEEGRVIFPLSVSHIIETSKRNDPVSRQHLAETQAKFSRGYAYRSRKGRLLVEVREALGRLLGLNIPEMSQNWVLACGFLQAFEELDELVAPPQSVRLIEAINGSVKPDVFYTRYMREQNDQQRRLAHEVVSTHAASLIEQFESARAELAGVSMDMRQRVYSAKLFIEHQDMFMRVLYGIGGSFEMFDEIKERAIVSMIEDVPTLYVEAAMVSRIESESGRLKSNDLFDIQSCYTAIPYSSCFVAEKASISRARQAGLDAKYPVVLSSSLETLLNFY